jgi:DNA-binding IclR family transcriptional regulator
MTAVRADSARSRKRGWALTVDELEVGLSGIAVPVHGPRGRIVAALGVSGPTPRLEDRLDELGKHLSSHAAQLSTLLRGRAPKEGVA